MARFEYGTTREPRDPKIIECHWCGAPWRAYRSTQKWCPAHSAVHMRVESERRR